MQRRLFSLPAPRARCFVFSLIGAIVSNPPGGLFGMDKKAKKRIEVLRTRLQKLASQLSGAKKQRDDPDEVRRLEKEIADAEAEIERLKKA